jgi:Zn-dependent peptidase ImmA (M78 family)/predicted secreted protein
MTTRRDAILTGTARAAELHAELGLRAQLREGDRPVDVLGAIRELGVVVLFRKLDSLLGAYLPGSAAPGMLLTTQRNLHVQRFTAAHELGHHALGHQAVSLDKEVGFVARGERSGHEPQELEADAFASAFLLPDWLIVAHARRHRWGKQELGNPNTVYQLSLRLGASYAATCWALADQIIDRSTAQRLAATAPKTSKQRVIPGVELERWHPDVWELSSHDRGVQLLGNPDDLLVLDLEEHAASGYTWDTSAVAGAGMKIEKDERHEANGETIGAPVRRHLIVQGPAHGRLRLEEKRAWDSRQQSLNSFELDLSLLGPETEGLPRAARPLAA